MVTDAEGNVTTYVYSDRDLLTEETSPVSGTTSSTYNEHGELTQEVDQRGSYDKNGNRTAVGYPNGVSAAYTYDFSDREATLSVSDGVNPAQPVVTSASTCLRGRWRISRWATAWPRPGASTGGTSRRRSISPAAWDGRGCTLRTRWATSQKSRSRWRAL